MKKKIIWTIIAVIIIIVAAFQAVNIIPKFITLQMLLKHRNNYFIDILKVSQS